MKHLIKKWVFSPHLMSWNSELNARHHINEPVEKVDWETAVMFAASSIGTT
jgi:hypothetical protein